MENESIAFTLATPEKDRPGETDAEDNGPDAEQPRKKNPPGAERPEAEQTPENDDPREPSFLNIPDPDDDYPPTPDAAEETPICERVRKDPDEDDQDRERILGGWI